MKTAFCLCIALLLHGAACAQETTLHAITLNTLDIIEAYQACAAEPGACDRDEAMALQADAKQCLRDFAGLVSAGRFRSLMLSPGQARQLAERAGETRHRIVQLELFDSACNLAIYFTQKLISGIAGFLFYMTVIVLYVPATIGVVVLLCTAFLIVSVPVLLASFVLWAPCLLWWL
jgi:hypothetical protein